MGCGGCVAVACAAGEALEGEVAFGGDGGGDGGGDEGRCEVGAAGLIVRHVFPPGGGLGGPPVGAADQPLYQLDE